VRATPPATPWSGAIADGSASGRLLAGTSGFAYPGWVPRFYPAGSRSGDLLRHYASRLPAVELNNTFYQQPAPAKVERWLADTPASFRFSVKAQRGGSFRAMTADPEPGLPWLTGPYRAFGDRLGTVLFRIPKGVGRDDARLAALLAAWPADIPLTMEFQESAWHVDETVQALTAAGAVLCVTEDAEDVEAPTIRRTGPWLYLRLRRHDYTTDEIDGWADRLTPFLEAGDDAYVFFRHDDTGRGAELALELTGAIARRGPSAGQA
jgi:uncharacterized protein YecE (DUF72 family)